MEKKSPGKYFLVFEPSDVYHQYAVTFTPSCDVQVTKIKKFTDLNYQSNKPVKKNLLGDIDKILTPCSSVLEFFDKYIDPTLFSYRGYNLHNMFIAYKSNGNIKTIKSVINNPKLESKLDFIEGSKFTDRSAIRSLINFSTEQNNSDEFLNFVNNKKNKRETGLSDMTHLMLLDLKSCKRSMESNGELYNSLIEKLTSYKEYRELYLLRQAYIEHLEEKKEQLEKAKEKLLTHGKKTVTKSEEAPYYEQYNLFGELERVYVKTRNKK